MSGAETFEGDTADARSGLRRVFFALWPDDATRSALVRATKHAVALCGGRPIAKERLHITVAFLAGVTEEQLASARTVGPVAVGPFDLTLDLLGVWPQSRVLWLAGRHIPDELNALETELWARLEQRGFEPEERIYRPHLTLARRARAVEEAVDPVTWRVTDLALVESLPHGRNVHYEVLERWPL
jgi:2'-5' RNA ligase